ncbi:hypothetical protein [Methylocapsa sp. S129]|uniref:hypothetical protein n=1 Tax=Methylocapsa sp. S129 TaxID=1641869 RepID=UPI00131DF30F|nr:hypothetical protein [Methylocapsa sp. S129]
MSRLQSDIAAATMPAFIIKLNMSVASAGSSVVAAKLRATILEDAFLMATPPFTGGITAAAQIGSSDLFLRR